MTKYFATTALVAVVAFTAPAAANTVLLEYNGQDEEVKNGTQNYDFFDLGPTSGQNTILSLATVLNDEEDEEQAQQFGEDDRIDMRITSFEDDELPGFGSISLLRQNNSPVFLPFTLQQAYSPMNQYMTLMQNYGIPAVRQEGHFATVDGEIATFGEGGNSGNSVDSSFNFEQSSIDLYGGKGSALLAEVGDSVILGFRIDVILEMEEADWGNSYQMLEIGCDIPTTGPDQLFFDGPIDCNPEPQPEILASFFGFVELTRGSVTPGLLGMNSQGGAAVVPTPNAVPLPASVLLLGAGLGGLGAMRRRSKA